MTLSRFTVPIYGVSLWIVVDSSLARAVEKVEDLIDVKIGSTHGARAMAFSYEDLNTKRQRVIVFLKPSAPPGTIAHEAKHAVNYVFSWVGLKLTAANDEAECYLLDWIVERAHRAIKRHKKKSLRKGRLSRFSAWLAVDLSR